MRVTDNERSRSMAGVWQVLLVDDHPIVRTGLSMLLAAEPDLAVCAQAEDVDAALAAIAARRPDLVLVDLSLRGVGGLDLVRTLARMQIRALVVSMHESPIWAERALAAGAHGYVLKSEAGRVIVDAIRRVRAGRVFVSATIAEALLAHRVGSGAGAEVAERYDTLTDREIAVLRRIGKGMTTRQIGTDLGLSAKTVQTYRERIKRKLLLDSAAALSREATRWVMVDTREPSA